MKGKFKIVVFLAFSILLIAGCKKNPFDYRTKYIGDYDFLRNYTSWVTGGSTTSGTISKTGRVEYGDKGEINIIFDANDPTHYNVYKIDRDGNLTYTSGGDAGKFESKNKVYYEQTTTFSGGGGTSNTTGTKK